MNYFSLVTMYVRRLLCNIYFVSFVILGRYKKVLSYSHSEVGGEKTSEIVLGSARL